MKTRHIFFVSIFIALMAPFWGGFVEAKDLSQPAPLTDSQLDGVVAGAFITARGDGSAAGQTSGTEASVTIMGIAANRGYNAAQGQVSASATSNAGPFATASSTLSLTVIFP